MKKTTAMTVAAGMESETKAAKNFKLAKPTLEKYTPTFEIDDGFRLTSEPTIAAISNDVRHWHAFSLRGADMHLFGAFMCGTALLRARDVVPKASRGDTKKGGYNSDGFDAWKRVNFPDISERALRNYLNFAENVYLHANDLSKTASVAVLQTGYKNFICPTTKADAGELLRTLGEVMDGATMTEMYRSQKRIREATPKEGNGLLGNPTVKRRLTDAEHGLEQQQKWVNEQWREPGFTRTELLQWLAPDPKTKVKPYLLLKDDELDEFASILHDLHRELCDARAGRGTLKRKNL